MKIRTRVLSRVNAKAPCNDAKNTDSGYFYAVVALAFLAVFVMFAGTLYSIYQLEQGKAETFAYYDR